ncbi:MAG: glycoside hydrolase family 95 protein [Tannerellaceae bacterium]
MKNTLYFLFLVLFLACDKTPKQEKLALWYNQPAEDWNQALPIGNGHAGAMIFGGVEAEQLQLNENTLYSGEPSVVFKDVKVTPELFDKVNSLMNKHKYKEASDLVCKNWLGRLHQYYQPFADLHLKNNTTGEVSSYNRSLNISDAIARITYTQGGAQYEREVFASNPENVIVLHLSSSKRDGIDISLDFSSLHPTALQKKGVDRLILQGKAPGYVERRTFKQIEQWGDQYKHPELYDKNGQRKFNKRILYGDEIENKGMLFEAQLMPVLPEGGTCEITDQGIRIKDTDEVYFILSLATSYNGYDKSPSTEGVDPSAKAASQIQNAMAFDYKTLKKRHTTDFNQLFNRVHFQLSSTPEQKAKPTDQRLLEFTHQADPELAALLFQYGRYLMISGSRPGGQALNLQGMWNKDTIPAWNCGYTININTEMNYWPAELTNLSECHEPLFQLIRELAQTGSITARNMYNRRGWVAHHNTSIWRESLPNDNVPTASFWPMVQGWLCSHLWEHYLFTQDKEFLKKEAYPLMKGAAEFYADWLVEDGNGHLVTPVGTSPENTFIAENGEEGGMSMGPTMDMAIVRESFTRTIAASELLNLDESLRTELKEKLERLLPYQIGSKGQLQEWMYDFKEKEPKHRHFSHLYGFHPGDQITPDHTPELFNAVQKTLELRGDAASGWSMGWKINCWARLLDGDHAYKIITNLFNPIGFGKQEHKGGGLFKNMLCAHPPFQIDGNFGYTAGVAEMLLQSHAGYIQLLPALPGVWTEGQIEGLKARGNFVVGMHWKDNALQEASILSQSGKNCKVRAYVPFVVYHKGALLTEAMPIQQGDRTCYEASLKTEVAQTYTIRKK